MVGVNYPWRHYGGDFGPTVWGTHSGVAAAPAAIAADLALMAGCGVQVVRWFVFADARGGIRVDAAGRPAGFLPGTLADLDAAFELALAAGLRLVPVLFDHTLAFRASDAAGARVGGHGRWLGDPDGQSRLLERVIEPVIRRYGPHGARAALGAAVHAWDLLNEPDWIVAELSPSRQVERPVPFDVLAAWVRDAADLAHRHGARVTIGGARLRFAGWWDDPRLGLDFLQAHAYYDPEHDFDLLTTPRRRPRPDASAGHRRVRRAGRCRRCRPPAAGARRPRPRRGRPPRRLPRRVAVELARAWMPTAPSPTTRSPRLPPTPPPASRASESPPADAAARARRRPRRTRARGRVRRPAP